MAKELVKFLDPEMDKYFGVGMVTGTTHVNVQPGKRKMEKLTVEFEYMLGQSYAVNASELMLLPADAKKAKLFGNGSPFPRG